MKLYDVRLQDLHGLLRRIWLHHFSPDRWRGNLCHLSAGAELKPYGDGYRCAWEGCGC